MPPRSTLSTKRKRLSSVNYMRLSSTSRLENKHAKLLMLAEPIKHTTLPRNTSSTERKEPLSVKPRRL
jgi:hypothetical protein